MPEAERARDAASVVAARRPEPCTGTSPLSRHLAIDLREVEHPTIRGRIGTTLCGRRAYDERAASTNWGRLIALADLKPCKSCQRNARTWAGPTRSTEAPMASDRDAAIQAARAMYQAEMEAVIQRRNDALKAWWAADARCTEDAYAATRALNEAMAEIDRDHPEEGR